MDINRTKIIKLPKFEDLRGNLSFIEELKHVPFKIERTYWIYDVPGGQKRGGHAFKRQKEFIVALSGSFDIIIDNGKTKEKQSFDYPACSSIKKAFNTTVIDLAKYDRYFLTIHFHLIQSSEALFPTVPGVSLSQSIPVTKSR